MEERKMAHEPEELKMLQELPLETKVRMTKQRINEWYDHFDGQVYVSFSGGKDSTVLLDIEAVFINTGLEYPEIRKFAMLHENVTEVRPKMTFREVILHYGYPVASKEISKKIHYARQGSEWALKYVNGNVLDKEGRPSMYNISKRWLPLMDAPFLVGSSCCDIMKKAPAHDFEKRSGKKPIVGIMAAESQVRKLAWQKTGCNSFNLKKPISKPLSFWTEQDTLSYIKKNSIPYASVYGEIVEDEKGKLKTTLCDRTGCVFCMFGCHLESDEQNRFLRLQRTHPNLYNYCMKPVDQGGLGLDEVLNYINVKH